MKEYIKIETVYERDMNGTKKLIEGQFRDETVEFLRNCMWDWMEKIDVFRGTIDDVVWFVKSKPMSTIGNAPMEGVVGRPYVEVRDRQGRRVIVKVKARDFE